MAAITDGGAAVPRGRRDPSARAAAGPDRVSVAIFTLAAFFAVFAVLAWQLHSSTPAPRRTLVVLRRVYETRVVETIVRSPGRSSVSQSLSSSGAASLAAAPVATRTS